MCNHPEFTLAWLRFSECENTRENLTDFFFPNTPLKNTREWRFTRKGSTLQPDDDDDNESAAVVVVVSAAAGGGVRSGATHIC